eukprot:3280288-Prymnesium_polylepis.1
MAAASTAALVPAPGDAGSVGAPDEPDVTPFEELALCSVCGEGDWSEEETGVILFCDRCNLGVHQ